MCYLGLKRIIGLWLVTSLLGCSKGFAEEGHAASPDMNPYAGDDENFDTGGMYADADIDADTDADADADYVPPEVERQVSYKVPQGAGQYVFIPDESRDAVVIVDSTDLSVKVVEVGSRPTHLVTLNEAGTTAVAVINLNSDDVTIIRMDAAGAIETADIAVRPDTNALAPSPDGRFIIAYHEPMFTAQTGAPHTDQEISVLTVAKGQESAVDLSVGMHPWKVMYNEAGTKAFIVTEGGINVVDLANLNGNDRSDTIKLFETGTYDADTADIEITPDGTMAIGRKAESNELVAAWLDGSAKKRTYTLPEVATDLDIAKDGTFGVVVLREARQVAFFDLPLAAEAATEEVTFTMVDLGDRFAGVATLSGDGQTILLHTTVDRENGDKNDRQRLTLMSRNALGGWEVGSAVLERPIEAVFTVDDGDGAARTAVVMHQKINASAEKQPYGYSLVTIPDLMPKLQQLSYLPGQLLLTPKGDYGFLLLEMTDGAGVTTAEKIDLATLIVDSLTFSSPAVAAGYAAETDKIFVAQDHPAGRMSFVGVHDNSFKTVTGYNLSDEIEVSP